MDADRDKVRQKLHFIEKNVASLRELASLQEDEFTGDEVRVAAAIRMLQVAIEAMIDLANHIVARQRLGLPKNYTEAFSLLTQNGILPADFLPTVTSMVKFRNRAVHLYDEIAAGEIHRIMRENLGDFERFIALILTNTLNGPAGG